MTPRMKSPFKKPSMTIDEALERRSKAVCRIVKALSHLDTAYQMNILASFIPLVKLEEIAEFQERGT